MTFKVIPCIPISMLMPLAMLTIAHMGASQEAPENTLESIAKAIEYRADVIEFDVRVSKDGIPVVIHDRALGWDKPIPESYPISKLTLSEIKAYDIGSWFSPAFAGARVPTLEEVLALGGKYMVEIKWAGFPFNPYVDKILPYLEGEECWIGCMVPDVVAYLKEKGFRTVGIVQSAPNLEAFIALSPDVLALRQQLVSEEVIQRLHALGIQVWAWTIDDVSQAKKFKLMGLDGVITNNVTGMISLESSPNL
ncbi:MAG: hypothetical protein KDK64_03865 [Chlamydiia bacterium]|nr:hypothetical protein [Chlamydiia bacterium]